MLSFVIYWLVKVLKIIWVGPWILLWSLLDLYRHN
jgi:hypothetical protein